MCGYSSFENGIRIFVDKYVGRQLKPDGLQTMFQRFFQGSTEPAYKMIPIVTTIRDSMCKAEGIRFHGSSLIMAYCLETGLVQSKIVDF